MATIRSINQHGHHLFTTKIELLCGGFRSGNSGFIRTRQIQRARLTKDFDPRVHPSRSSRPLSAPPAKPIHPTMLRTSLQRTTQSALSRPATQFTRVATPLCRRAYADAAPAKSDNLKLSLSVPHKSIFSNKEVYAPTHTSEETKQADLGF